MIITKDARPARRLHPLHTDVVLDGNRHPREHAVVMLIALLARPFLNLRRTLQRPFPIDLEKSIERLIEPLRGTNGKLYVLTRHGLMITTPWGRGSGPRRGRGLRRALSLGQESLEFRRRERCWFVRLRELDHRWRVRRSWCRAR